ncbi:MAG: T9SS type A sorting domain-containing protein [Muribaculaceae bacterium]|nr:T9SS type A sorting domain-containing protein [Muribaculaceae bacterium]
MKIKFIGNNPIRLSYGCTMRRLLTLAIMTGVSICSGHILMGKEYTHFLSLKDIDNNISHILVDSSLTISMKGNGLVIADDQEERYYEIESVAGFRYEKYDQSLLKAFSEDHPLVIISGSDINITMPEGSTYPVNIYTVAGVWVSTRRAESNIILNIDQFDSGAYILTCGTMKPVKFIVK